MCWCWEDLCNCSCWWGHSYSIMLFFDPAKWMALSCSVRFFSRQVMYRVILIWKRPEPKKNSKEKSLHHHLKTLIHTVITDINSEFFKFSLQSRCVYRIGCIYRIFCLLHLSLLKFAWDMCVVGVLGCVCLWIFWQLSRKCRDICEPKI